MREIKNAALIGLGAIGGYVAPKLFQALGEENFKVIAGGTRRKRLEQDGIMINGKQWKFQTADPSGQNRPADLIILSVKFTALDQAISDIRSMVGRDTVIMSLLNGVESEERIKEAYPDNEVLYSVIRIPALHQGNEITFPEGAGKISFGNAYNDRLTENVLAVRDLFEKSGISYEIPKDMLKNMWHKFMTNVSENQSAAVLRVPYGIWTVSPDANELREQAAREVIAIAEKKGINLTEKDLEEHRTYFEGAPFYGKPSTLQDIEAGRKTEVEMFAGSVIKMGKELGIPTPYNQMFYYCIKTLETWNEYQRHHK
ncbi:ketopantoate reductase family protein [Anaerostipes sp.]|uniref:ketopantoate reductase family protein n=1 Tax=Anaerostipes sp. TaxID=1872530 RepID=UPI0025BE1A11|nr:ketopantoate reductase family protein [Anaerostipes sp.]MBS7006919.1 ketopantoate reductase family protein [Anaerostipes sp.]